MQKPSQRQLNPSFTVIFGEVFLGLFEGAVVIFVGGLVEKIDLFCSAQDFCAVVVETFAQAFKGMLLYIGVVIPQKSPIRYINKKIFVKEIA